MNERIKELEADNAKKLRQIENGMKGARILEGRIKELEDNEQAMNDAHCKLMAQSHKANQKKKEVRHARGR